MIKVFAIDGVLMPHIVEWPGDQDIFRHIQQFCETDMAKPCHKITSEDETPHHYWELIFWGDEDALMKANPQRTLMFPNRWGGAEVLFGKIVGVAQDINGEYISVEGAIEAELTRQINAGKLHFEVRP